MHLIAEASPHEDGDRDACLAVDRLEELCYRLRDAGHEVERLDAIEHRPQAFFYDPFGNLLELTAIRGPYA